MSRMKNLIVFSAIAIFAVACQKQEAPKVLSGLVTFISGKAYVGDKRAKLGAKVELKDNVKTKKKSAMTIQFAGGALLTLKANTNVKVQQLLFDEQGLPVVKLEQKSGISFSKIKNKKAIYSIGTPTAVAGVRGTAFSVSVNKKSKSSEIKLLRGEVEVTSKAKKGKKQFNITSGQKVTIAKKKGAAKTKKLSKKEVAVLEMHDSVKFTPTQVVKMTDKEQVNELKQIVVVEKKDIGSIASKKLEIKKEAKPIERATVAKSQKTENKEVKKKEAPKKLTLSDLKKKYGGLTKIKTSAGKEYIGGNWKQVGNYHFLTTVNGEVKINTSKVSKVLPQE